MTMPSLLVPVIVAAAAMAGGMAQRWLDHRRQALETARNVEAERIVALLSNKQPGVWDHEDLRERIGQLARDYWTLPTRDALDALEGWVAPGLLEAVRREFPARAVRREVDFTLEGRVAFVQVAEGGPHHDRLVARLQSRRAIRWFDPAGRALKRERSKLATSYHTWLHVDGRGWHLAAIAQHPPLDEPPSSVSCRIHSKASEEKLERH